MPEFERTGHGAEVPEGFLPAALPDLLRVEDAAGEPSLIVRDREGGTVVATLPGAVLRDPRALGALLEEYGADAETPAFLGPRIRQERPLRLPPPIEGRAATTRSEADVTDIGVIDVGLAFWSPVFRRDGRAGFHGVGALGLERGDGSAPLVVLPPDEVARLSQGPDAWVRDREARAALAGAFPESVLAAAPASGLRHGPSTRSHGTAMAALAARGADPRARLYGLELPAAVLADPSGRVLSGLLGLALDALVAVAMGSAGRPVRRLVVVLAFAFTDGPQDGRAAVLRSLEGRIAAYARAGLELRLVVPMGNHLQDRGHALVGEGHGPLRWRLQPDDHSPNLLTLVHPPGAPAVEVVLPDGSRGVRPPGPDPVTHVLWTAAGPVGAIRSAPHSAGVWRTEIATMPTAARGAAAPRAPVGLWRIEPRLDGPGRAWLLRDDLGAGAGRAAPRRPSWLEDPAYRARGPAGLPATDDALHPASAVRRLGTASLLATSRDPMIVSVGALWTPPAGPERPAPYSGAFEPGHPRAPALEPVDAPGPAGGRVTSGTGLGRPSRISGSSAAAASHAGRLTAPP